MLSTALALAALALPTAEPAAEPIPVLIVSGANNHDWKWTSPELERILEESGLFAAEITYEPGRTLADAGEVAKYRAFVLDYNGPRWGEAAEANFLAAVEGGAGVSVIHAANNAFPGWTEYERMVGYLWREGTGHGRVHPFEVTVLDRGHPVTRGLFDLVEHTDELYHTLWRAPDTDHAVLATAWSSVESGGTGRPEPMITVGSYGKGRVFHTPLGHVWEGQESTRQSFTDRQFRELVVRGTEWAATGECSGRGSTANLLSKEQHEQGWRLLFDGFSTQGWTGFRQDAFPEQGWKVEDGALVLSEGGGGDIVTEREYGDFELDFEWRVSNKANSGVIYRVSDEGGATYVSGPEYQVLDDAYFGDEPQPLHAAGALYALEEAGPKSLRPVGQFNRGRIVVRGWEIEHWINGQRLLVCDLASDDGKAKIAASKFASMPLFAKFDRGRIALQDHGNAVAYRNLRIRELDDGSIALFNGRDLSGWEFFLQGGSDPKAVWSVDAEGNLVCTGTPAGYIMTDRDYSNYVLELDWRWDPVTKKAGNSGVLLRKIDEDKVWPKSLEAQLMSGSAGDFWMIGEFPATTVPERTNGRNAKHSHNMENPVGEWNHYRISVDHGLVTLEINGQVVNQASGVLEVPGRICLQSEGAPIHFRNVRLTPID
jgi:type 1 glutamine amidotransferase